MTATEGTSTPEGRRTKHPMGQQPTSQQQEQPASQSTSSYAPHVVSEISHFGVVV